MRKILKLVLLQTILMISGLAFFIIGAFCAREGLIYFIMMEPKTKNWTDDLSQVDPSKMWIIAAALLFCGMFTGIIPLLFSLIKFKEIQQDIEDIISVTPPEAEENDVPK